MTRRLTRYEVHEIARLFRRLRVVLAGWDYSRSGREVRAANIRAMRLVWAIEKRLGLDETPVMIELFDGVEIVEDEGEESKDGR